jgi:hypothetical protein
MSYEIFYALRIPSTTFEKLAFSMWFLFDISFALTALFSAYSPAERGPTAKKLCTGVLAGILFLYALCTKYPDERDQVTAYWTGILLQLPIGWAHLLFLLRDWEIRGQGLEIWYVCFSNPCFRLSFLSQGSID